MMLIGSCRIVVEPWRGVIRIKVGKLICSRFVGGCHLYCVKRQALYSLQPPLLRLLPGSHATAHLYLIANAVSAAITMQSCNRKEDVGEGKDSQEIS